VTDTPGDTGPINPDGPTPRANPIPGGQQHPPGGQQPVPPPAGGDVPTPETGVAGAAPSQPARRPDDRNAAALFRVHMFPIGYLPVPVSRPVRQLPAPEGTTAVSADRNDVWGVSGDVNSESITRWLDAVGVPRDVVSLGVAADNAWCLLRSVDQAPGEASGAVVWEVFWQEQGSRHDWARFTSEQVACHYLFGRLAWAQVARGAVGVVE